MNTIRLGIWFLGVNSWLFGLSERTLSASIDNYLSANDLILLFTASFFCVRWLFLYHIENRR